MNQEQFTELCNRTTEKTTKLLISKGAEYASDSDRLANFKVNAERLGMTPLQVWSVYAFKHVDAVQSYMRKVTEHHIRFSSGAESFPLATCIELVEKDLSEPIEGRFHDLINYAILGLALLEEIKNPPEVSQEDAAVKALADKLK